MTKLTPSLQGENVKIKNQKGEEFVGQVTDFIYPEDNEPEGVAGICITNCPQRPGQWIGFNEPDILAIEILTDSN